MRSGLLSKAAHGLENEAVNIRTVYFLAYASGAAWYPLFNLYLKQAGLAGIQIGIIASILPVMMLLSQPFWGMAADRWGRHRVLLLTILMSAFVMVGFVWCKRFTVFFIWTTLFALLFNPVAPLIDSTALDCARKREKTTFGHLRVAGSIGWIVMAPITGWIITGRSMSLIFPAGAFLLLLSWLVGRQVRVDKTAHSGLEVCWKNLGFVLRNIRLIIFLVLVFFFAIGTASIWTFYSVYLDQIGASRRLIGCAFSLQGISELPFFLIGGAIISRIGTSRTLILAFLVTTGRLFLYSFISNPVLAMLVEVTQGLSYALFIFAAVEHVDQLVPSAWRATGQSLFWAAYFGAGAVLGNVWAGFLFDRVPVQKMFQINGYIVFALTLAALIALRTRKAK